MGSASSSMSASPLIEPQHQTPLSYTQQASMAVPQSSIGTMYRNSLASSSTGSIASSPAAPLPGPRRDSSSGTGTHQTSGAGFRGMSVGSSLALPLSKVDIGEKEEGEISDEEDNVEADSLGGGPSIRPAHRQGDRFRRSSSPKKRQPRALPPRPAPSSRQPPNRPAQAIQSSYRPPQPPQSDAYRKGNAAIPVQDLAIERERRERETSQSTSAASSSPQSLSIGPADITPDDAKKYMDIIRQLLQNGVSPDMLIQRGATAKYVTAVCEEIVEGTKKRKALWLGAKSESSPSSQAGPSTLSHPTPPQQVTSSTVDGHESPDSEVEILISTERRGSISSEGSAEFELIENPSPRLSRRIPFPPTSHWAPSPPKSSAELPSEASSSRSASIPAKPPPPKQHQIPPKPIMVETYKPNQSAPPAVAIEPFRTAKSPPILPSSVSLPRPVSSFIPTGPASYNRKKDKGKGKVFQDSLLNAGPATLNYDDDESDQPASAGSTAVRLPPSVSNPVASIEPSLSLSAVSRIVPALPRPITSSRPAVPPISVDAQAEIDAKNAILETRRKALESMRLRRKAKVPTPEANNNLDLPDYESASTSVETLEPTTANVKSIEQEVLDLEQEVRGLQEAAEEVSMDIDSPEEGEITPTSLPAPLPPLPTVLPIAGPSSMPAPRRGVKRPNAEELDARPITISSWTRRKPFGGSIQRPNRLIIPLDEDSESESDDDEPANVTPFVMGLGLVQEKEEQIRLLREKIAAKMKERAVKKMKGKSSSPAPDTAVSATAGQASVDAVKVGQSIVEENEALDIASSVEQEATEGQSAIATSDSPQDQDVDIDQTAPAGVSEPTRESIDQKSPSPPDSPALAQVSDPHAILDLTETPDETLAPAAPAGFTNYTPLIHRYPQLSINDDSSSSPLQAFLKNRSAALKGVDVYGHIDRGLLYSVVLTRRTGSLLNTVCPAEAGGGTCAIKDCPYTHIEKGSLESKDWVEYVTQARRRGGRAELARETIQKAVEAAHRSLVKDRGQSSSDPMPDLTLGSGKALDKMLAKIGTALGDEGQ